MDKPTVDLDFLVKQISNSPKILATEIVGDSTYYIRKGGKNIADRMVVIPNTNGQVTFEFATGAAINFKFIPELLDWLEKNRKWKDGAYFA